MGNRSGKSKSNIPLNERLNSEIAQVLGIKNNKDISGKLKQNLINKMNKKSKKLSNLSNYIKDNDKMMELSQKIILNIFAFVYI